MSDAAAALAVKPVQSPLTLIMTIKDAQAAQELQALLHQLQSAPPDKNPLRIALDSLQSVHFARFVFLENDTKLAVITTYDGSFEDYINEFVDSIGDIFDALLQRMAGAPPLPVQKYRAEFLKYVQSNDLRGIEPFYSAYPQATVVDILSALNNNQ